MDLDSVGRAADGRAGEIESLRRLPDDLAAMIVDTGLLRQWVPARYGGGEADIVSVLDGIETLAYHDGSTGWFAMIGATSSLVSGYLDAAWGEAIFGDPRTVLVGYAMPAGTAQAADGGLRVNGHWQWGSGIHHATVIAGGTLMVGADGKPAPRADGLAAPLVIMMPDQVEILDTWRVAGLKGTGSTDYRVADGLIPEGRWVQLNRPATVDSPLYRFPFLGALALGVASVSLGLARRAQDELVAIAGGKRPANSGRVLAERPVIQAQVAKAEAAWRSARAFMREVLAEVHERAADGALADDDRRRVRLAATNAVWQSAAAVDLMYHAGGGSSIHEASPLQRVFRDVHVTTQHGMVAERVYEPLGRMALGLPTDAGQL